MVSCYSFFNFSVQVIRHLKNKRLVSNEQWIQFSTADKKMASFQICVIVSVRYNFLSFKTLANIFLFTKSSTCWHIKSSHSSLVRISRASVVSLLDLGYIQTGKIVCNFWSNQYFRKLILMCICVWDDYRFENP